MTPELTGLFVLVAAVTVESFAQVFLKIGATGGAGNGSRPDCHASGGAPGISARGWVLLGIAAYALEIALYTAALHFLDLSVAFPLGSLCFVGVAILSKLFLGETVGRIRWLGVGCILVGTVFVAL
jgi:undecaprenyl phosphate-alpha-L-ara4N flippase subunit ArnE